MRMLHNCALMIKNCFTDVNSLIASVKATTCNTLKFNDFFKIIEFSPDVVVTRWNSWLNAAIYYHKYFRQIHSFLQITILVNHGQ